MSIAAELFMCGRSQAIRLPAKLRLAAKQVRIERVGNALWVQAQPEPGQNMADWLAGFYKATEPLPAAFLADCIYAPPQSRDRSQDVMREPGNPVVVLT
jgi:antitoxin VapB